MVCHFNLLINASKNYFETRMFSKSYASKLHRKQKRCQAIVSKETNIKCSETPTQFIAICNAGLSTGLEDEKILQEATRHGQVENLIMLPNKSYCFLKCPNSSNAEKIFVALHGQSELGQNNSVLYLSYFEGIPDIESTWNNDLPPGLKILKNFIDEREQRTIMTAIQDNTVAENNLKHRAVKHYGYEFLYGSNQVDPSKPMDRKIPIECNILWSRLEKLEPNLDWYEPDQLTVNQYSPGQGIPPHVDTHSAFLDPIMSLSLESDYVMEFRNANQHISILLPCRSLLIMSGESRYDWTHGITPRHMDIIPSEKTGLTVMKRERRTSLTFRKLRKSPCCCSFPNLCDTRQQEKDLNKNLLKSVAAKLEMTNVHSVYDEIANHFSETRHSPWPKVTEFLKSFEIGSILLDVGCGNGKYLGINQYIAEIGCDRSQGLLEVCTQNSFNVFKCDCLQIPFRDNSVNACISIAVIHHLATEERRYQAICEMARILQNGGRALIYVWAKNQEVDSKKSSYLRQNKAINRKKKTETELRTTTAQFNDFCKAEINLPIHTNRTQFQEQDVLVPWKLKENTNSNEQQLEQIKNKSTFLRYYHVFEEFELENLCGKLKTIKIINSYYDQGNWCIIFEKL